MNDAVIRRRIEALRTQINRLPPPAPDLIKDYKNILRGEYLALVEEEPEPDEDTMVEYWRDTHRGLREMLANNPALASLPQEAPLESPRGSAIDEERMEQAVRELRAEGKIPEGWPETMLEVELQAALEAETPPHDQ